MFSLVLRFILSVMTSHTAVYMEKLLQCNLGKYGTMKLKLLAMLHLNKRESILKKQDIFRFRAIRLPKKSLFEIFGKFMVIFVFCFSPNGLDMVWTFHEWKRKSRSSFKANNIAPKINFEKTVLYFQAKFNPWVWRQIKMLFQNPKPEQEFSKRAKLMQISIVL